ncbi:hypothetical protein RND81_07G190500 [Saponaria officinalis]|uniref:Uncharacterized protein n=1 Tax=Saponaria officinalis TaxID=3572 RepID=A0AAW1JS69_SAPOF
MEVKKSVTIISSTMVRPTGETPTGSLWLSRLDMMASQPNSHTRMFYVYQQNKTQNIQPPFFDTDILKKSLGKALVPFYTMAGRLHFNKTNGRYEIDCNAEGVLFVEAETECDLTDLGSETNPNTELKKELFPTCDYSKGLSSMPLLMVQLTRFKCGGVCLGIAQHHNAADGSSYGFFVNSWARLTKGLDIKVMPVHDRFKYVAPRNPPRFELLDSNYFEPSLPPSELYGMKASTTDGNFVLSEGQINVLKQEAISSRELSSSNYGITTFMVLAGHVWRSVCKARNFSPDQDVKLYMLVNGRSILKNPALPLGYTGNAVVYASCKAKAGDIVHKPLWYAVSKVCEALTKMKDSEYFRSAIDYIETRPSLEPLYRRDYTFTSPNLWINNLKKMTFNESDFGWGTPKFTRHGGVFCEGRSAFVPAENDGGNWLLSITLYSVHMTSFEKYMYEFQTRLKPRSDKAAELGLQFKGASSRCKL